MFNFALFGLLLVISLPGIVIVVPRLIKRQMQLIQTKVEPDQLVPPQGVLVAVGLAQTLLFVAIPAAIGTVLASRAGFAAPVLTALLTAEPVGPLLRAFWLPTLLLTTLATAMMLAAYYGWARPRLDRPTLQLIESQRLDLGLGGRLLYGGIVEEVLARWGLMTLFVWLGSLLVGEVTAVIIWMAIILSGVLFGLAHMPSLLAMGARKSAVFVITAISLNLWVSLVFGWLFWQYGLVAAMLSHMLLHLLWYPVDRFYWSKQMESHAPTFS